MRTLIEPKASGPSRDAGDEREGVVAAGIRTLVVCPALARGKPDALRSPDARREEAVGLARAIDLAVAGGETVSLSDIGR